MKKSSKTENYQGEDQVGITIQQDKFLSSNLTDKGKAMEEELTKEEI